MRSFKGTLTDGYCFLQIFIQIVTIISLKQIVRNWIIIVRMVVFDKKTIDLAAILALSEVVNKNILLFFYFIPLPAKSF